MRWIFLTDHELYSARETLSVAFVSRNGGRSQTPLFQYPKLKTPKPQHITHNNPGRGATHKTLVRSFLRPNHDSPPSPGQTSKIDESVFVQRFLPACFSAPFFDNNFLEIFAQ
ncbi:MAG: hypothetical protein R3B47_03475 [Bacteroidia bacterium]